MSESTPPPTADQPPQNPYAPTAPGQQPVYPGYPAPAQAASGYAGGYLPVRDHPQATAVLVLGIAGLVFFQLLAPVAWVMGARAKREIDASGGMLGGRDNVVIGMVCGIVGTVILAFLVIVTVVVVLAVSGAILSSS